MERDERGNRREGGRGAEGERERRSTMMAEVKGNEIMEEEVTKEEVMKEEVSGGCGEGNVCLISDLY